MLVIYHLLYWQINFSHYPRLIYSEVSLKSSSWSFSFKPCLKEAEINNYPCSGRDSGTVLSFLVKPLGASLGP